MRTVGVNLLLPSKVSRTNTYTTARRKSPHPKRAVNARRTVLKVSREEEEPNLVLCLRIPDEEDGLEANHLQIQKEDEEEEGVEEGEEEITVREGAKRKIGHECDVCEKVFRYPSQLTRHMRTHTNEKPYECDVCWKCFSESGNLKRHMRIHTNEKPYECDFCDKAFRDSGTLKSHMRTHTNERPYECDVCEWRFREFGHLRSHKLIHTGEKPNSQHNARYPLSQQPSQRPNPMQHQHHQSSSPSSFSSLAVNAHAPTTTTTETAKEQLGRITFQSTALEKVNSELFSLTYGAFLVQLLRDANGDASFVNAKLRGIGKSIGNRLIEEYLAKMMNTGGAGNGVGNGSYYGGSNNAADSCKTFREVMENVAFVGFRMFLNARCRLVDWSSNSSSNGSSGNTPTTNDNSTSNMNSNSSSSHESVTLAIEDLSLADFVELPEKYTNSLSYCEVVCGVVEGALESVNVRVKVHFVKDGLRSDLSSSYVGQTQESERVVKNCKFALRVTSLGPIEDEPYPFQDDD
ncbi:unnamed protein product [Bathycoccus prasinos]